MVTCGDDSLRESVLCLVETSVAHNSERVSLVTDYTQRTHLLSQEVQHLKRSKQQEVNLLIVVVITDMAIW